MPEVGLWITELDVCLKQREICHEEHLLDKGMWAYRLHRVKDGADEYVSERDYCEHPSVSEHGLDVL